MQSHSLLADLEEDRYRKVKTEQWETLLDGSFSFFAKAHLVVKARLILAGTILQMLSCTHLLLFPYTVYYQLRLRIQVNQKTEI